MVSNLDVRFEIKNTEKKTKKKLKNIKKIIIKKTNKKYK